MYNTIFYKYIITILEIIYSYSILWKELYPNPFVNTRTSSTYDLFLMVLNIHLFIHIYKKGVLEISYLIETCFNSIYQ